jgi:hypothetical protein
LSTSGGRLVGIVRLRTKGHGGFFVVFDLSSYIRAIRLILTSLWLRTELCECESLFRQRPYLPRTDCMPEFVDAGLTVLEINIKTEIFLRQCKIWGVHGSDYELFRLLGYKNQVRTSQETHYFSATESSQLMLCKIWGVHGSDYELFRLLGYKNQVRTSQETVSATVPSQLMLCKICVFHGGDYEECRLLGCYDVWLL